MKCLALGLSTVMLVCLAASTSAAQNAAPPPAPPEPTQEPPTPSAEEPTPQPVTPPIATPPVSTPPNVIPPNPTLSPARAQPQYQYPYPYPAPPYGYGNPYARYGWGLPPKELAYDGKAVPYGYKVDERYNLGLLIAGPTLFGLAYIITAVSAVELSDTPPLIGGGSFSKTPPWQALYIPVVGPMAFAAYAPGSTGFIYATEGIAQAVGVGLFLISILRPKEVLVRKEFDEAFHPTVRVGPGRVQIEMRF